MKDDYITKINSMLDEQKRDKQIYSFFSEIEKDDIQCIMIGGAIRDIINDRKPRDIDLILNIDEPAELELILKRNSIDYHKNAFNGYKLFFSEDVYDVWLMKNHYSFKQKYYQAELENLKETTFTNYDSLIYDIKNQYLEVRYYKKCVDERMIDFVGNKTVINNNPMRCMNVLKILKTKKETNYALSEAVQRYLWNFYQSDQREYHTMLEEEYYRHYEREMDTEFSNYIYQYFSAKA